MLAFIVPLAKFTYLLCKVKHTLFAQAKCIEIQPLQYRFKLLLFLILYRGELTDNDVVYLLYFSLR